jgi:small conductance mechanosensitive channel
VNFWGLSDNGQQILTILFGFGVMVALLSLTQISKKHILKALEAEKFQSFKVLTFLWTATWSSFPVFFYLLFILDSELIVSFLWPVIGTLLLLPLAPLLYRGLRLARLTYLKRVRMRNYTPIFYETLLSHTRMNRASKILAYGFEVFAIVEIWDFHLFFWVTELVGKDNLTKIGEIVFLIIVARSIFLLGERVLRHYLDKMPAQERTIEATYQAGRLKTLLTVARAVLRVAVWGPCLLLSLSILGYNISVILTSLGIFSVTLTFGVQSLVKDFVTGFFILLENSIIVGDQVDIDGKTGTIEDLSLRTLRIRNDAGTLQTIPFGSITVIGNKSRNFSMATINFTVRYDADPEKVLQLLEKAYEKLRHSAAGKKKILAPLKIKGLVDVTDYSMVFQATLKTAPNEQDNIKSAFTSILKQLCDEEGIRVPSPPYPLVRSTRTPSLTSSSLS